jgi:hypothetical protein
MATIKETIEMNSFFTNKPFHMYISETEHLPKQHDPIVPNSDKTDGFAKESNRRYIPYKTYQ